LHDYLAWFAVWLVSFLILSANFNGLDIPLIRDERGYALPCDYIRYNPMR